MEQPFNVENPGDVLQAIRMIKAIDQQRFMLAEDLRRVVEWYNDRLAKLDEQKTFAEGKILGYLEFEGRHNIPTPSGTASIREIETWEWPDEGVLKVLAEQKCPQALSTETKVSKSELKKAHRTDGLEIPGLKVTTKKMVVIGKASASANVVDTQAAGVQGNGGGNTTDLVLHASAQVN